MPDMTGELLIIGQQSGQIYAPEPTPEGATDRVAQKLHLMNTLTHLAGASMRAGLVEAGQEVTAQHYGTEAASNVLTNVEARRVQLIAQAKRSFALATGRYTLVDDGLMSDEEAQRTTRSMFSDFLKRYYGTRHHEASFTYRKQLESEVDELMGRSGEVYVSEFNRKHNLRPHLSNENKDLAEVLPADELDDLDTRERLTAILADPRAGFLPTTNNEKNRVLSWLDYLDNPENPLGIVNQLREVLVHAQNYNDNPDAPTRRPGISAGVRAVESITWEEGDTLIETTRRLRQAQQLRAALDQDQRPTLNLFDEFHTGKGETLAELFGEHAAALAAYVQRLDTLEFIETGKVAGLSGSPLRGTEFPPRSQRPKFDYEPGRRKTELNQYTRPDILPKYKLHIIERLKQTTVGNARKDMGDFLQGLEHQKAFHERRLIELAQFDTPRDQPIHDALFTILDELAIAA